MTFGYAPFIRLSLSAAWKHIWVQSPLLQNVGLHERAKIRFARAVASTGYAYGLFYSAAKQTSREDMLKASAIPSNVSRRVGHRKEGACVAVVIPALVHTEEHLAKLHNTLTCVQTQSVKPDAIFLVDDGSPIPISDQLEDTVLRGVTIIRCRNSGPAAARNKGLEAARNQGMAYVCFTDADCLPDTTWLEALVQHFKDNSADDIVGGITRSLNRTSVDRFHDVFGTLNGRLLPDQTLLYALTCNLGIRTTVAMNFNSDFSEAAYEDIDFCLRARKSGLVPKLVEQAGVVHDFNSSLGGLFRQFSRYGRWESFLLKRHPNFLKWLRRTKDIPAKKLFKFM